MTSFVADDDLAQALAEMDIPTFDDFNESDDDDAPLTSKEVSLYADSPPSPSPSTFPVAHLYKSVYSQSYSRTPTQTSAIESLVREMGFEGYLSSHPTNSYGGTRPQSPTDEERDTISELLTGAPLTPTHSNSNSNSNSIAHPTISHILTTKSQSQQNNNLSERVILHRGSLKKRGTQSTIKKTNWREVIVFSDGVIVCKVSEPCLSLHMPYAIYYTNLISRRTRKEIILRRIGLTARQPNPKQTTTTIQSHQLFPPPLQLRRGTRRGTLGTPP